MLRAPRGRPHALVNDVRHAFFSDAIAGYKLRSIRGQQHTGRNARIQCERGCPLDAASLGAQRTKPLCGRGLILHEGSP